MATCEAMQDKLVSLVREVERLVTAPYVPSLQNLYGILQEAPHSVVQSWASCKPCQVAALVDVFVDGLSYSTIALDLIGVFAPVPAFRNALLERYPAILDQLLQKAVENGESKHISTCTALLSPPLPANFTTPARLAGLITKIINQMAEIPSAEKIRPIYKLITGLQTSPRVLYDIPAETMSTLQGELLKTLRNMDDHMGNLLCLATFATIASSQNLDTDYEHGPPSPSWLQNVRHFFGPKRGLKTLDLVVLRVILACSASCNNLTIQEAAESVRLAIRVCDTVEPEQKQVWISGNASKIAKLCEKVTREGINREVQLMGVVFLTSLLPASALSPSIPWIGLQGLLSKDSHQVLQTIPLEFVSRVVEVNAMCSGRTAVCDSLKYAFSALKSLQSTEVCAMPTIKIATSIVAGLRELKSHPSGSIVTEVSLALGKESIEELVESFPRQPRQPQCGQSVTCYAALSAAENSLFTDLFDLYCHASVSQNGSGENTHQVETSIISKFTAQVKKAICESRCSLVADKPFDMHAKFSYLNIREVSSNPRRDWRSDISEALMSNAHASLDGLMRKVEEACRDMEHRCYDTETPLRAIEENQSKASLEAEHLRQHSSRLETQLQQAFNTINDLQQSMSNLEGHAETATVRVEELSTSLDAARQDLEDQRRSFEESSRSEREQVRTRELGFMATMTEKDDQLEELQAENQEQRAEAEELRNTLASVSKEHANTLETVASLRGEISKLEGDLEINQQITVQKDIEVSRLLADKEHMDEQFEKLRKMLESEASESNKLRTTLGDAEEQFRNETDATREHHEMQLSQANAESTKQKKENKALQESMQAAASELQTKDKRIRHLERKIQSLRDERAAKAREFSVAQEHIGRLMAVMGFKSEAAETSSSSRNQQRSRPTITPSQFPAQQTTRSGDDETQSQTDNPLADSFEPNTPNPNGRTPKRPRGNSMTPLVPRSHEHDLTPRALPTRSRTSIATRRERRPLEDADRNTQTPSQRSPAPSQPANQFVDANKNKLQELDLDMDLEFTKDFLFTSTDLSEANSQRSP